MDELERVTRSSSFCACEVHTCARNVNERKTFSSLYIFNFTLMWQHETRREGKRRRLTKEKDSVPHQSRHLTEYTAAAKEFKMQKSGKEWTKREKKTGRNQSRGKASEMQTNQKRKEKKANGAGGISFSLVLYSKMKNFTWRSFLSPYLRRGHHCPEFSQEWTGNKGSGF